MSPEQKRALICGISGQDGACLAEFLLRQGYRVVGTSRDAQISTFANLAALGVRDKVTVASMVLTDFRSVLQILSRIEPDEVYNLAGQSSVGLSFEQPVETLESIATGTLNLLEAVRFLGRPIRIYNAGSSECFGDTGGRPADEATPFRPRSPYAVAKAAAYWQVANYREAYGLFACTGILFNHESPLRPERFVTRKITAAAARIAARQPGKTQAGQLGGAARLGLGARICRGHVADAAKDRTGRFRRRHGRGQQPARLLRGRLCRGGPRTGRTMSRPIRSLFRPAEIMYGCGNPAKAKAILNWQARSRMRDVVRNMLAAEQNSIA